MSRRYAEGLLQGIDAQSAATLPRTQAGQVVQTNHPTFVYGHLALYPPRILVLLGRPGDPVSLPERVATLFHAGQPCRDDPDRTIYPPLAELSDVLMRGTDAVLAALAETPDLLLAKPNPNEQARARLPTIGAACTFYLVGHTMLHLGQVSAWRRCMGLPSAF